MVLNNNRKQYLLNQLYFSLNASNHLNLYYFNNINLNDRTAAVELHYAWFFNSRVFNSLVRHNNYLFKDVNVGSFFILPATYTNLISLTNINFSLSIINNYLISKNNQADFSGLLNKIVNENYSIRMFINFITFIFTYFFSYFKLIFNYFNYYINKHKS
jgi:hypothetical protein